MATSLGALKSLPCPAGDSCTAFQCLFKHARDSETDAQTSHNTANHLISPSPSALTSCSQPTKHLSSPSDQEVARTKRLKTGASDPTVPKHTATSVTSPAKRALDEQRKPISMPASANIQEVAQPHSSTRNTPNSAQKNKFQGVADPVGHPRPVRAPLPTPSKAVSTPPPKPKPAPREPESLNPRLLQKAPCGHSTRVALVQALHKEYERLNSELKKTAQHGDKKLILSVQQLITKTLDDEQEIAVKKFSIYNTSIRNFILQYKKMALKDWKDERMKTVQGTSSEALGATAGPLVVETGLTPAQEIKFLQRLVWDLSGLAIHGYVSHIPDDADIRSAQLAVQASGNTENCDRCSTRFQIFPGRRQEDGALASNGVCHFHPGKMYRDGTGRRYRCCNRSSDDEAGGCTTASTHVFKTTDPKRLATVLNFANTPTNPSVPEDRAVAFDCEMGFTVFGLELIRMTVVSWPDGKEMLDVLVQPAGEVLDLNTRYSGVRPEDMASAEVYQAGGDHRPVIIPSSDATRPPQRRLKIVPSPKAARDLLFTLISAETPLIGHGLENDLNAARIIHPTCIDTVLLYPHQRGLPIRHGLKYLMDSKLHRKIQVDAPEGSPEGHDSAEDARAAGDLVRLKIQDEWKEMKLKGWALSNTGELLAPGSEWTIVGGAKVRKFGH
ncbi:hypothetical protein F5Y16DRAFT_120358 [Xylariaceae sp. FL0255]|nr:hypothetical protein F5Y16DRAFT_120358 [Xylariaceae sp. FL0255]